MKSLFYLAVLFLAACGNEEGLITYVCEEPLDRYLEQARLNIANDYEAQRSRQVLENCPAKGYHRRYTFRFDQRAMVSKQTADATVTAAWCRDPGEREATASLTTSASTLRFRFDYPWSTETGKYPRTEFQLSASRLMGGFFEELDWSCRLVNTDQDSVSQ